MTDKVSFGMSYCFALFTVVSSALGLFCALVWRDVLIGLLRRYKVWNTETGFKTHEDIFYALLVAIASTAIAAMVSLLTTRCKY
jgi:hypothetical protein